MNSKVRTFNHSLKNQYKTMVATITDVNKETLEGIAEQQKIRGSDELFILVPLGSQTDHLIAQQIAKLGVFCLPIDPASITAEDIYKLNPKGIFISGSQASVGDGTVSFDMKILGLGIPVLGICYGAQLIAKYVGANVVSATHREFGIHQFTVAESSTKLPINENILFDSLPKTFNVVQSHGDKIVVDQVDNNLRILGSTEHSEVGALQYNHLVGIQFHAEVSDTEYGSKIFENFIFKICKAQDRFPAQKVGKRKIEELAKQIDGKTVLLALSGGSDSSICAYLLKEAKKLCTLPTRIYAVYIKGVDRPDDEAYVKKFFGNERWIELYIVDATQQILDSLKGKFTMKEKRKSFKSPYGDILNKEAQRLGARFIMQGTLYTDLSESGHGYVSAGVKKAVIKEHHNVGHEFCVPELTPLDDMVKDNARDMGREIGVPEELLVRHPFPGPGLTIRIIGEVNAETLAIARIIDSIYIDELRKHKLYEKVWQAGAVVTDMEVSCQKGDGGTTGRMICLWAVWSVNGFTAQFAELPWSFLKTVSTRITNTVKGAGSVDYRISDKPPATIEVG